VNGLAFVHFDETDVVRHHLVQRIIRAYDEHKTKLAEQQLSLLEPKAVTTRPTSMPASEEPHVPN
jgi:phosphate starvation-inducible PhoH-like protein